MRSMLVFLIFMATLAPSLAQQASHAKTEPPSAEFLEFLAEFNMQSEHDDKDYDIIQHHALQDLKHLSSQEQNNDN